VDQQGAVWAIILAAGTASRAGSTKQLLELDGKPLLQHVLDIAAVSRVDGTVLVLGHDAKRIRATVEVGNATVVINPAFASGQASSLIAGIDALPQHAGAAIVLLGDQPGIRAWTIDGVIDAWRESDKRIVVPVWRGERGNPVLFSQLVFGEIRELHGDTGARAIFRKHQGDIEFVAFDEPMPPDVDTPEDYAALIRDQAK